MTPFGRAGVTPVPYRWAARAFVVSAALALLAPAQPARAHPIDEFVQQAYLTPAPSAVSVELDLSPGVLVAPAALADLDPNGDRQIADAEATAYAERVLGQVRLRVDDRPLALALTDVDVSPYLTFQAGYGTVRLSAEAHGAPTEPGTHHVLFRNDFAPRGSAYQVNAFIDRAHPVEIGTQRRDTNQQQSLVEYRIGGTGGEPAPARPTDNRLLGVLQRPSALRSTSHSLKSAASAHTRARRTPSASTGSTVSRTPAMSASSTR